MEHGDRSRGARVCVTVSLARHEADHLDLLVSRANESRKTWQRETSRSAFLRDLLMGNRTLDDFTRVAGGGKSPAKASKRRAVRA